jgi:hypothetical protein
MTHGLANPKSENGYWLLILHGVSIILPFPAISILFFVITIFLRNLKVFLSPCTLRCTAVRHIERLLVFPQSVPLKICTPSKVFVALFFKDRICLLLTILSMAGLLLCEYVISMEDNPVFSHCS